MDGGVNASKAQTLVLLRRSCRLRQHYALGAAHCGVLRGVRAMTLTVVTTPTPGTTGNIDNPATTSATPDPNSANGTAIPPQVAPLAAEVPAMLTWALLAVAIVRGWEH